MKKPLVMLAIAMLVLIWSLINPKEYFTAFLEVLPGVLGILVLLFTYKKFRFTNLTYFYIMLHCIVLFIGGHYTYAEVPLFDWLTEAVGSQRNNYDKLGHFMQGYVPALITREIFIRKEVVAKKSYLNFLIVSVCLAISAAYELIEWLVSVLTGEGGDSFLGTQGYVWDTQSDMLFALIGAICALIFLSGIQDKAIANLKME